MGIDDDIRFQQWSILKTKIHTKNRNYLFREGDVWWCSIGQNIGHEINGKNDLFERPILIIRKFNSRLFLAVAMSTSIKKDNPYYLLTKYRGRYFSIIISQCRIYDASRLQRRIRYLPYKELLEVRRVISELVIKRTPLRKSSRAFGHL